MYYRWPPKKTLLRIFQCAYCVSCDKLFCATMKFQMKKKKKIRFCDSEILSLHAKRLKINKVRWATVGLHHHWGQFVLNSTWMLAAISHVLTRINNPSGVGVENYRSSPASCPSNKPISLWCLFAQIWPYHSHPFLNRRPVCPSPRPLTLCSEEQMALNLAQGNAADAQGTSINTLTYTEIESNKKKKTEGNERRENYLKVANSYVFHLGIHNSF